MITSGGGVLIGWRDWKYINEKKKHPHGLKRITPRLALWQHLEPSTNDETCDLIRAVQKCYIISVPLIRRGAATEDDSYLQKTASKAAKKNNDQDFRPEILLGRRCSLAQRSMTIKKCHQLLYIYFNFGVGWFLFTVATFCVTSTSVFLKGEVMAAEDKSKVVRAFFFIFSFF